MVRISRRLLLICRRALPGRAASMASSDHPQPATGHGLRKALRNGVWLSALAVLLCCSLTSPGHAAQSVFKRGMATPGLAPPKPKQKNDLSKLLHAPKVDHNAPMLLQSDQMIYDNKHNRVIAQGNVEIYYSNYTLLADKVIYDRNANTLTAVGNVRIKDPDGAVITSNRITLTDDFRDGFIQTLRLVTKQDTRIVAQTATREAGNVTVFKNGWFTPCKPCQEHPDRPPAWRIRAKEIIHRKDQATITFKNAAFDFFGVPVAWLPYFKTADSTVKRKTGLLLPTYSHSSRLGDTVTIPYYFALSNHYDFTFTPMITSQAGTLMLGDWRQNFSSGSYHVELAGVLDHGGGKSPANGDFRGSIKTAGRFALDPEYSFGWDVLAESDDTFRRYYGLDSPLTTDRVSQIYLEGIHGRNYFSTRLYQTGGLLYYDDAQAKDTVLPIIDYDYYVPHPVLGGELSFNSNTMALWNDNGTNSDRFIVQANWRRQIIDSIGEVYTPFAQLRGDAYHIENYPGHTDNSLVRGNALVGGEYSYPFVATTGNVTNVIEPVAEIIARPNSVGNQNQIPNEDAQSLVFDDTILFSTDKFSGYDRMETGTTANVGLRYTAQLPSGAYIRTVFGQSYHLAGKNSFDPSTGLSTDYSDYVTGIYVQATSALSFMVQSRFDHKTWAVRRTDIGANADYGPVTFSLSYANVQPQPGYADNSDNVHRQEVESVGSLALTDRWSLLGNVRYDLANNIALSDGIGLRFQNDCFTLDLTYVKSNYQDLDIQPDERIMAQISLKYLGTYQMSTGASAIDAQN